MLPLPPAKGAVVDGPLDGNDDENRSTMGFVRGDKNVERASGQHRVDRSRHLC